MPGTPPTTTRFAIPRVSNSDPADFAGQVNPIVDRISAVVGTIADLYTARPTADASLNDLRFFATDKSMEWQCIAGTWVLTNIGAPEVSALPTSPIDQQECILILDAAAGIKVRLRYRSASSSTYKWETVGVSAPLVGESTVNEGAMSGAWANVSGALTIPVAGEWDIEVYTAQMAAGNSGEYAYLGYKIGATTPAVGDAAVARSGDTTPGAPFRGQAMRRRHAVAAAGTLIQPQFQTSAGLGYPTGNSTMPHGIRAWPVRLG